jgi:hypothetical protein
MGYAAVTEYLGMKYKFANVIQSARVNSKFTMLIALGPTTASRECSSPKDLICSEVVNTGEHLKSSEYFFLHLGKFPDQDLTPPF